MSQLSLAPNRVINFQPIDFGTAHAIGHALADDGCYYIVKSNGFQDFICATEYVCHSIADDLKLPIMQYKALQMHDGSLAFGSQDCHPKIPTLEASRALLENPSNGLHIEQAQQILSATYAFDLAVRNPDRHVENFLLAPNSRISTGRDSASLKLIDFSGSDLLTRTDTEPSAMPTGANTVQTARITLEKHGFSPDAANRVLDTLEKGDEFIVEKALAYMPDEWLSREAKNSFMRRVKEGLFRRQIDLVREGLKNGVPA